MGFETLDNPFIDKEYRVWKLPMGFETQGLWCKRGCRFHCLKAPYGIWNAKNMALHSFYLCLKAPYGIWNREIGSSLAAASTFESSLWDLKPSSLGTITILAPCLKAPYGIWNEKSKKEQEELERFESSLWDLKPQSCWRAKPRGWFESSLWDLKHQLVNIFLHTS